MASAVADAENAASTSPSLGGWEKVPEELNSADAEGAAGAGPSLAGLDWVPDELPPVLCAGSRPNRSEARLLFAPVEQQQKVRLKE